MKLKITLLSALLSSALGFSQAEFVNNDFGQSGLMCVDIPGETIKMGDIIKVDNGFYGLANFRNHHLVKFSSDGQLDTSFGTNGYQYLDIGYLEGGLGVKESHILTTPDNNFLIVSIFQGAFNNTFIAKTDLSGQPVSSFGNNGFVSSWGTDRIFFYAAEIVNNEIVLTGVGNSTDPENLYQYLIVMKYDLNGNPVTSFGNNGSLTAYFDNDIMPFDAHYYTDSDSIIMIGAYYSAEESYSVVTKYDMTSGTPDTTFGTNGQVIYNTDTTTYASVRTLNCFGSDIYIGGYEAGESQTIFLKKLDANGQPNTAFGINGTFTKIMENTWNNVPSYVAENNGDFLITGILTYNEENYDKIFLLKVNADGTPATDFGNNGMIINPMNLAHIGGGFHTIIENNIITVATLSLSCSSDDQPKPAVVQFVTGETNKNLDHQLPSLTYYPNPVKDILNFTEAIDKAEVYDITGKLVLATNAATQSINLNPLQKGLYMVRASQNGTTSNIKIIKE